MIPGPRLVLRSVSVSLATLLVAGGLAQADSVEAESEKVVKKRTLTDEQWSAVSKSGTGVLEHIAKALDLIGKQKRVEARYQVGEARAQLLVARAASPSLRLHDALANAIHSAHSGDAGQALLMVEADMQSYTATETEAAGDDVMVETLNDATKAVTSGDTEAVTAALVKAQTGVRFHEVDLPIDETYHLVNRALIQLDRRDLAGARASLREAQGKTQAFVELASASTM